MQILRATSRSINKDRFYQSQQDRKKQIHLQKIRVITSSHLKPLKVDSIVQKKLRKAKSAAKIFQKQEEKINIRLQNRSLLSKLVNVQSTLKPFLNKQISETNKLYGTSSNWLQRKKQTQKAKKQNQFLTKRCSQITNTDLKDLKKKMQEGIKQYLQLRDNIRKMRPQRTSEPKKRLITPSKKKIIMGLPLCSDQIVKNSNNQEQLLAQYNDKFKSSNNDQIQIHQKSNSQSKQSSISNQNEKHQRDPFKEVLKLRQLKKLNSSNNSSIKNQQTNKAEIKKAQQITL